jgi:hypothetical protein
MVHVLAALGAIPFVLGTILLLLGHSSLPVWGQVSTIMMLKSYSLAIMVFLNGAHWGSTLMAPQAMHRHSFLLSNLLTLAAWFGYLLLPDRWFLMLSVALLLKLCWIDWGRLQNAALDRVYFKTRALVTATVVACLLISVLIS